jgi:decaprenylphospho-beta-D-erythro-pentofuranosid-2-ulose 2-reductase
MLEVVKELQALGIADVEATHFDVLDTGGLETFAREAQRRLGSIDLLLVAAGMLGANVLDELDAEAVVDSIETNFAGPAASLIAFAKLMRAQGHGRIVVFSSVAGVRVRRSNFVYGGAKAGLDGFCQGLSDALAGTGVELMIVRPGFVYTKMTAGLAPAPFAVHAEEVASAVVRGLEHRSSVVWVPSVLAVVFAALQHLPRRLWRLLPG